LVAVNPIKRQNYHHDEVGNQHARIERVPPVQMFEGLVRVVRLPVVPKAMRSYQHGERRSHRLYVVKQVRNSA
jgi:hypothetical protein